MSTFAHRARIDHARSSYHLPATLLTVWRVFRESYRERRRLVAFSRKDPRLLRDMGLDPERIYEALDGTLDAVGPAHFSPLLRRTEPI